MRHSESIAVWEYATVRSGGVLKTPSQKPPDKIHPDKIYPIISPWYKSPKKMRGWIFVYRIGGP